VFALAANMRTRTVSEGGPADLKIANLKWKLAEMTPELRSDFWEVTSPLN
jgi:hypothetical protein